MLLISTKVYLQVRWTSDRCLRHMDLSEPRTEPVTWFYVATIIQVTSHKFQVTVSSSKQCILGSSACHSLSSQSPITSKRQILKDIHGHYSFYVGSWQVPQTIWDKLLPLLHARFTSCVQPCYALFSSFTDGDSTTWNHKYNPCSLGEIK